MPSFQTGLRLIAICVLCLNSWGRAATDLPTTVMGLRLSALGTQPVQVAVRDQSGHVRAGVEPGIAVLRNSRWSPNDPSRDGACEFEVLVTLARLFRDRPLAGIVGVGDRYGVFQPVGEKTLARVAAMGVPVVRLSSEQAVPANSDNLFIEAGALSEAAASQLLSSCMLGLGLLPPAADPANPTPAEQAALREKIARYQLRFDAENARMQGNLAMDFRG